MNSDRAWRSLRVSRGCLRRYLARVPSVSYRTTSASRNAARTWLTRDRLRPTARAIWLGITSLFSYSGMAPQLRLIALDSVNFKARRMRGRVKGHCEILEEPDLIHQILGKIPPEASLNVDNVRSDYELYKDLQLTRKDGKPWVPNYRGFLLGGVAFAVLLSVLDRFRIAIPAANDSIFIARLVRADPQQTIQLAGRVQKASIVEPTDSFAVNEYLRHGSTVRQPFHLGSTFGVVGHVDFFELHVLGTEQRLRPGTIGTVVGCVDDCSRHDF